MFLIDTHTHLYEDKFEEDRNEMIQRAFNAGIQRMLIPNVDTETIQPMLNICADYPEQIFPMLGLHPCYVKPENYKDELDKIYQKLKDTKVVAVGEIGIDLFWDKTTFDIQREAFEIQCNWALEYDLPIAIHSRESTYVILDILKNRKKNPTGVFHCFTGSFEEAKEIIKMGFKLGIGGVITYKNTNLRETLSKIDLQHLVLETDAPYLSPVPYRGKRNESAYIQLVAEALSGVYQIPLKFIIEQTTRNAQELFKIN